MPNVNRGAAVLTEQKWKYHGIQALIQMRKTIRTRRAQYHNTWTLNEHRTGGTALYTQKEMQSVHVFIEPPSVTEVWKWRQKGYCTIDTYRGHCDRWIVLVHFLRSIKINMHLHKSSRTTRYRQKLSSGKRTLVWQIMKQYRVRSGRRRKNAMCTHQAPCSNTWTTCPYQHWILY